MMAGKWTLHRIFTNVSGLKAHIPETALLNSASAERFLGKYRSVYIKPIRRHMGIGIIKAWRSHGSYRYVKVRSAVRNYSSLSAMLANIGIGRNQYIVQRDVNLARYNKRPFDIRVMMMRGAKGQWRYCGMVAKVAGAGSVITNVAKGGGYAAAVDSVLGASFSPQRTAEIKRKLLSLSRLICSHSGKYKYTSEIGIDYGIDPTGKIWLIEVNYDFPSHGLFNRLRDKTYYRTIKRTKREYLSWKARRK